MLPGLIDAHIHPTGIAGARSMLTLGVTTGRSMFAWNYADLGLRALHARGDADIPTVLATGYPVVAYPARGLDKNLCRCGGNHEDLSAEKWSTHNVRFL